MTLTQPEFRPGQRVRITQRVVRIDRPGGGTMSTAIEGTITRAYQGKTGSWFAHSKDKKLWLDRLELRKDDGEMVVCNLDQFSEVEVLNDA